jgi:hypothetical protein
MRVHQLAARARRGFGWRLAKVSRRVRWLTRRATARLRLRPTYLVIGAQKSGTTSLHSYLEAHPAVLCASTRAVRYFSLFYGRGEAWYRAHFPLALHALAVRVRTGAWPAVGETSTTYLFDPRAPERVHRFSPRMKLVAVLRDPVDRAYSHYQMERRWGREQGTFEEALAREAAVLPAELERLRTNPAASSEAAARCAYLARSRYGEQLERWLQRFPREQLFVVTSDELLADPGGVTARLARFLGIPVHELESYPLRGVREYPPLEPAVHERLARGFEPDVLRLEKLLGRPVPWSRSAAVS